MNDLLKIGAQMLSQKLGLNLPPDTIANALGQLLGQKNGGELDLVGLIGPLLQGGGAGALLGGLLGGGTGDGGGIAPDKLADVLGTGAIGNFAKQIGVSAPEATDGLASMLPQLLQQVGGGDGLAGAASALGGLLGGGKKLF